MTDVLYKPPGSITLDTPDYTSQLRLGIQGEGGTGKTWACTTFPNPIFISFDRGLICHIGRPDIIEVPFYDGKFVDSIKKRNGFLLPPDRKEALIKWLESEGPKIPANYTLILDNNTGIQSAYHQWWQEHKEDADFLTRDNKIDTWKEWRLKIGFFTEIVMSLRAIKGTVVYLCHESPDRNDQGNLNGQVRPLLTGQFQDELLTHFTDWFRAVVAPKPINAEQTVKFKERYQLTDERVKEFINSNPTPSVFLWQTISDTVAKCKTSLHLPPKYILADYKSFTQYQRKTTTV